MPSAYVIVEMKVSDPQRYQEYMAAAPASIKAAGGEWAGDMVPLGSADYSASLIKAKAYNPDVLIDVMGGGDQVNSLKQFVGFGLEKQMAVSGTLFELESLRAVPPDALIGWWTMEWWWDQPGNKHVAEFVAKMKKATGQIPSARNSNSPRPLRTAAGWPERWKDLRCHRTLRCSRTRHSTDQATMN